MKHNRRFLVLFANFLLSLFLIEGITRLFFIITHKDIDVYRNFSYERGPRIFIPDSLLGYKLIPNVSRNAFTSDFQIVYKTNSIGLREKEIEDTNKFKIIFLGDSMTFGEGVEFGSRFSELIEKEIYNVYTINAGVPGYGIHQMYAWLKYHGINLKPDLVICAIIGVDLDRILYDVTKPAPHLIKARDRLPDYPKPFSKFLANRLDRQLMQSSYFYPLIKTKIKIFLLSSYLKKRDRKIWNEMYRNGETKHCKITTEKQKRIVREKSSQIFLEFKKTLEENRIKFLVVNICTQPIPWLNDFFNEHNIEYLDLSPKLSKITKMRFAIDPHYNAKGNRAIADLLRDYLLCRYKMRLSAE